MGRRPKSRRGVQRTGVCAYCGKPGPMTQDHVFAEMLFLGEPDPQMVTAPTCRACHDRKSAGDGPLRDFVPAEINGSRHPNALRHMEKMARATHTNRSLLGRAFLDHAAEQDWVTDSGLYLGRVVGVPTDTFRGLVLTTVEFQVRGLYFHEAGGRLPLDCPVDVVYVEPDRVPAVLADLRALPPTNVAIKGNDVAGWVSWRPTDAPHSTQWLIGFNNAVFFLAWTGSLALSRRRFWEERSRAA